jgi:hypothetical protein
MRVKVFGAMSEKGLEKKLNDWLEENPVKVIDIKFSSSSGGVYALVMFE